MSQISRGAPYVSPNTTDFNSDVFELQPVLFTKFQNSIRRHHFGERSNLAFALFPFPMNKWLLLSIKYRPKVSRYLGSYLIYKPWVFLNFLSHLSINSFSHQNRVTTWFQKIWVIVWSWEHRFNILLNLITNSLNFFTYIFCTFKCDRFILSRISVFK